MSDVDHACDQAAAGSAHAAVAPLDAIVASWSARVERAHVGGLGESARSAFWPAPLAPGGGGARTDECWAARAAELARGLAPAMTSAR
jgi:hypothetical protein